MMGQGGRGKIRLKEEKKDKRWVNKRRDDEVPRKGNAVCHGEGPKWKK